MTSDMGGDCHTGRLLPRLLRRPAPNSVFWLRAVARRCGGGPTPVSRHAGDAGGPWVRGRHPAAETLRARAMKQVRAHTPGSQRAAAPRRPGAPLTVGRGGRPGRSALARHVRIRAPAPYCGLNPMRDHTKKTPDHG